ncbi:MAG TPA: hypothetical protein VJB57_06995, partial [Dehalococcoidia bacterium]|nr:hypothetical protein [Dehalococcoidia bacterium]
RVGNQWFVDETCLTATALESVPLISAKLMEKVARVRRQISTNNPGYRFDVVELLHKSREGH